MTVVVGYTPDHRLSGALELASAIAEARREQLLVVTVVPPRWNFPSLARQVDGEFADWAAAQGTNALEQAKTILDDLGCIAPTSYRRVDHKSAGTALLAVAEEVGASVVVIGSSEDGKRGHVEVGSTGMRLLHSARIPVALAPRGYTRPTAGFDRITCSVAGENDDAVITVSDTLAKAAGIPLRLVTFAVRLDTVYTSNVGFDAEDEVAEAARDQSREFFAGLRRSGLIGDDVETLVGMGRGWRAAMGSLDWTEDELLVIGSHPTDVLTRVFLGSNATKIVRHSPVPVIVLPA
ncbi:MAG: universal stress protein [Gordonia sp. (in: high G+C Gram-positive bacteria)]|uniref:universal stress protein n=1 Tax=Gordonia sp. (in: high G+C Gram-positive bacteria) TaxID=84139 RepID=UPI0039E4024E